MVVSNKQQTAEVNYNKRVVECRIGSAIIAKKEKVEGWDKQMTLSKLQELLNKDFDEMLVLCERHLKKGVYSLDEISSELEIPVDQIKASYISRSDGSEIKLQDYNLKAFDRAYHVFSEEQRVQKFMLTKDLDELGQLMNESHYSLRDLYECSCDELEELTKICRDLGAYGSRLTGAGW
jgi:N-acetylgalactosamine kinase